MIKKVPTIVRNGYYSPMNIILNGQRERVVDDKVNTRNIQSSGCYICGDQQRNFSRFKLFNGFCSPILAFISMDTRHLPPCATQIVLYSVRFFLIQYEYEDTVLSIFVVFFKELLQPLFSCSVLQNFNNLSNSCSSSEIITTNGNLDEEMKDYPKSTSYSIYPVMNKRHSGRSVHQCTWLKGLGLKRFIIFMRSQGATRVQVF